ncbi:uncharacterized protein LOC101851292 [Aplysia californica]|uniref:Uncharacterized protein LOC101851292 n=1 Tax=Aplysia californica TaxID=6500 RepID=A0ABM0K243_APLCA|nr:uncharacterized protein LOC101851292 [Aplysia californica]
MHNTTEIPPVPRCFSHLVVSADGEEHPISHSSSPSSSPKSAHSYLNVPSSNILSRSTHDDTNVSVPKHLGCLVTPPGSKNDPSNCATTSFQEPDGTFSNDLRSSLSRLQLVSRDFDEDSGSLQMQGDGPKSYATSPDLHRKPEMLEELANESIPSLNLRTRHTETNDPKSPFVKLNSSLVKLQEEMKSLRYIDITLFYQLVSLHEAIQDFKLNMTDRFSETGSEYSLGTASYMGSMSSLNESDWTEDGMTHDDADVDTSTEDNRKSASSLLQQITDLAMRADKDF